MSDSPHVFDDDRGRGRPLTEHERRRLHDIAARLDLADPGFGARIRFSSDRLSRRRGRRPVPPRSAPSVAGAATPEQHRAHRSDAEAAGGALSARAWRRSVQASVVVVGLLVLFILVASGPWAVLAISLLCCLTPLMAIVLCAYHPEKGEPPGDRP